MADNDDDRSRESSDSIEFRTEHPRHLPNEQVADYASADASQHPHQRSDKRIQSKVQRFLRARYREQSKAGGIEYPNRAMKLLNGRIPEKGDHCGQQGCGGVAPVTDRCGGNRTDQQVADDAAKITGRERYNENTEEV